MVLAICWQFRAPLVGKVWGFEDIGGYFLPHWAAAARQMRLGLLGQWVLGAWSGHPLVGDPQVGMFYPPNWLWMVVPVDRLYAWLGLGHALLGAFGVYRLARLRGAGEWAAATGGLCLGLSAFTVLELRHIMFVASIAWLPWVLVAVEIGSVVGVGLALGMALLAGGWSMLLFGGLAVLVSATAQKKLRVFLPGLALALALSAVQLAPAAAHAMVSARSIGTEPSFASSYAWPSRSYFLTLAVPTLFGSGDHYRGAPDQWELCGYGFGVVGTLLALFALKERRREHLAFVVLTLVAGEWALGSAGWLHPLFGRLLDGLRCPARAMAVWTVAGPIVAASGAALLEKRHRWLGALAMLAVAVELLVIFRHENPSMRAPAGPQRPEVVQQIPRGIRIVNDVHLAHDLHNAGLAWGRDWAGGYSSLPIWRYLHFLWIANHGSVYPHAHLADDLTAQGLWRFSSPLVDLLSVEALIAPRDRPPDGTGWRLLVRGSDGVDLWRNLEALPRGCVVHHQKIVADDAGQAAALVDLDPLHDVIVSEPQAGNEETGRPCDAISGLDRIDATELAMIARGPGVLVTAEPWAPGWRASVDGKEVPCLRVDYALRGVALGPGYHRVKFRLVSWPLRVGGLISVAALLVALWLSRRGNVRA
jgi:hypothetical protein